MNHLTSTKQNKSFTDVTFIVGPAQHSKKYVGHRVLLAMTSPVFETMFYGDMADKNKYIRIADVAPIGFENLLRFAYTDSLKLGSVEDAMLTAYAAKKYLLPELLRECLSFIEANIGHGNACVVFEFAQVLNSHQLVLQAMNIMDRQTSQLLGRKSLCSAQASTIEFIANRRYLSLASEYQLASALLQWSLAECRRRDLNPNNWLQVRALMLEHNLLGGIRFLAMSQQEFARFLAKSTALTTSTETTNQDHSISPSDAADQDKPNRNDEPDSNEEPIDNSNNPRLVDTNSDNSLLSREEQCAIFMNLALPGSAKLPAGSAISGRSESRVPPPEMFTLMRFDNCGFVDKQQLQPPPSPPLSVIMTSTRKIHTVYSKFQCLNENVFIVALTIPIRLEPSSYINRTPKFECHLKFTTKHQPHQQMAPHASSTSGGLSQNIAAKCEAEPTTSSTTQALNSMLMDSLGEALQMSISRDKDCVIRLKRPILIRMGNLNEISLTFQNYALDEDVALRMQKHPQTQLTSEIRDPENIHWLFYTKSSGSPSAMGSPSSLSNLVEFSELHYYY